MRGIAVALCLGLSACAQQPPAVVETAAAAPAYDPIKKYQEEQVTFQAEIEKLKAVKKVPLSASQRKLIVASIRNGMVDPASTKIGAVASGVDENGATNYCVWVNSKNGYGGYAGPKPYAGRIVDGAVKEFDSNVYGYNLHGICSQLGLSLENLAKPI